MTTIDTYVRDSTFVSLGIHPNCQLTTVRINEPVDDDRQITCVEFAAGPGGAYARLQFASPDECRSWLLDTLDKLTLASS